MTRPCTIFFAQARETSPSRPALASGESTEPSALSLEHIAVIGLGSNLGDRRWYLECARDLLAAAGPLEAISPIYETEPVDTTDQPDFLNQVVVLRTAHAPLELLRLCLAIERALGRTRSLPKGPRTIDLDLLLYDDLCLDIVDQGDRLTIPHPRLHERRFVLVPLCDLLPAGIHPVLGKSFAELLAEVNDPARVTRWSAETDVASPPR